MIAGSVDARFASGLTSDARLLFALRSIGIGSGTVDGKACDSDSVSVRLADGLPRDARSLSSLRGTGTGSEPIVGAAFKSDSTVETPAIVEIALISSKRDFLRSLSSRILLTVSSSSPRSAQAESETAADPLPCKPSAFASVAVRRLDFLSFFFFERELPLTFCNDDVLVGMESTIRPCLGDGRFGVGDADS